MAYVHANMTILILFSVGLLSLFLGVFVMIMKFRSSRQKRALEQLMFATALLLLGEASASVCSFPETGFEMMVQRVGQAIAFCAICLILYSLNSFITSLFMETGKFHKLPKQLLAGFILPWVDITIIIISQFTGIYYYYDEFHQYHRGPLYLLASMIPLLILLIQLSFVFQNRELINQKIYRVLVWFDLIPIVATVVQLFVDHFPVADLVVGVMAVILYSFVLVEQNTMLMKMANTDVQTGIPNVYGYFYEIEQLQRTANLTDYDAFYFDIHRMSQINSKFGKANGDEVIVRYVRAIKETLAPTEILARPGGNFFVALILRSNAEQFLELLRDVPVELDFEGEIHTVHLSAVAGGYHIQKSNMPAGMIMNRISSAVSYAKTVAKVPVIYMDSELEKRIAEEQQLETTLRAALANHEFEPFYQPKVDAETNLLCGSEALVRWFHNGEMIAPYKFIPTMERNGSICDLDMYVLRHVCKDMKQWIADGMEPPRVSVNLSRKNLGNAHLLENIKQIIDESGVPKDLLQIELTETLDEYPLEIMKRFVEELREYGLTVAIDDFGTGSSSINLLKEVTFDVLKVDRSFVNYKNEKDKTLLAYIFRMADVLGIDTIAEGVEEQEQLDALYKMGCGEIQGYIFDKPLPKSEYEGRLKSKKYN